MDTKFGHIPHGGAEQPHPMLVQAVYLGALDALKAAPGPTKRELFAAMAMQGELAAQSADLGEFTKGTEVSLARRSVELADALLAALAEEESDAA